jgi:hypothetical protein
MWRGSRRSRHGIDAGAQRAGHRHPCRCLYRDGERKRCFLGAFPAARAERIGSDIDVRATVVLMGEPSEITWRKRLFQSRTIRCVVRVRRSRCGAGEQWCLPGSEATGQEVGGGLVHRSFETSQLAMEARRQPGSPSRKGNGLCGRFLGGASGSFSCLPGWPSRPDPA